MGCARRHPLRLGQTVHVAPQPAPCRFHSPFILKELAGFAFCPASVRFFHRHLLSTSSPLRFQVRFVPFWNADPLFSITSPVRFCKNGIFCPTRIPSRGAQRASKLSPTRASARPLCTSHPVRNHAVPFRHSCRRLHPATGCSKD